MSGRAGSLRIHHDRPPSGTPASQPHRVATMPPRWFWQRHSPEDHGAHPARVVVLRVRGERWRRESTRSTCSGCRVPTLRAPESPARDRIGRVRAHGPRPGEPRKSKVWSHRHQTPATRPPVVRSCALRSTLPAVAKRCAGSRRARRLVGAGAPLVSDWGVRPRAGDPRPSRVFHVKRPVLHGASRGRPQRRSA